MEAVKIYTVYRNPSDYPGKYVVRIFHNDVPEPSPFAIGDSLEEVRSKMPEGLINLQRDPKDDDVIVETWL